jgi:DMSO/TMAO reductase YedYZ molybdopterin-dependent catalytic subunit
MNNSNPTLRISGLVQTELQLTAKQLAIDVDAAFQVADIAALLPKRTGAAVQLQGLLELCKPSPEATHIGLHGSLDDFHASIPLAAVCDRGLIVHHLEGAILSVDQGGPFRFFIPDHAACQMDEIDECANVKFLDHIEFTAGKGHDNRPQDEQQHTALHAEQDNTVSATPKV